MFRNLLLSVLLFYVVSVAWIVAALYALMTLFALTNYWVLIGAALVMALLMGLLLGRLAIGPLKEYIATLERLSKEMLHEINLPVATIRTNTQMLSKKTTDEKSLKRLLRITSACDMLKARYDELDYLIRMQTQREQIETVELAPLIRERIDALQEIYPNPIVPLDLESISLSLDRMGLIKVIDNLIDNAAKHSPKGAPIEIGFEEGRLTIRDHGSGMDEVELFRIFDAYYQSDATMPGFGIGLGLVKSYCDRQRIELGIDTKKGEGTAMILDFRKVPRP